MFTRFEQIVQRRTEHQINFFLSFNYRRSAKRPVTVTAMLRTKKSWNAKKFSDTMIRTSKNLISLRAELLNFIRLVVML